MSFEEIARIVKMEELEEENQKRIRKNNVIIHMKKKPTFNRRTNPVLGTLSWFKKWLKLCVGAATAKSMERIGNVDTWK